MLVLLQLLAKNSSPSLQACLQSCLEFQFLFRLRHVPKVRDCRDLTGVCRTAQFVDKIDQPVVDCLRAAVIYAGDEHDANDFGVLSDVHNSPDDLVEYGLLLIRIEAGRVHDVVTFAGNIGGFELEFKCDYQAYC